MSELQVHEVQAHETHDWFLKIHYAKRIPNITFAFGLYRSGELIGVVTYGKPASPTLCSGVCGDEWSESVYELNRLCLLENGKNQASFLVGASLRMLAKPKVIVSYADSSMNHNGYIYQATNFIYTGLSEKRMEWQEIGTNKHSRTVTDQSTLEERKLQPDKYRLIPRPRKHRYIYFCGNKKQRRDMKNALNYPVFPYPKDKSERYEVTETVQTQMVIF